MALDSTELRGYINGICGLYIPKHNLPSTAQANFVPEQAEGKDSRDVNTRFLHWLKK
jgi:hypothetical protein